MSLAVGGWAARLARVSRAAGLNRAAKRVLRVITRDSVSVRVGGLTLQGPVDSWRILNQLRSGTFEPYAAELFVASLRPGATVLDIGANVGYYTLLAARQVGATGAVYAFEPDPRTRRALQANVRRNGATNVRVLPFGVSDTAGERPLFLSRTATHTGLHRSMEDATPESIEIELVAIDDLDLGPVDVIKMDIEGEEPAALAGMRGTLGASPDVRLFLEWNPRTLHAAGRVPGDVATELTRVFEVVDVIDEQARRLTPFVAPFGERALNLSCSRPASRA